MLVYPMYLKLVRIHSVFGVSWLISDFFDFFFKSCGGQKKGKILKKVAVVLEKNTVGL